MLTPYTARLAAVALFTNCRETVSPGEIETVWVRSLYCVAVAPAAIVTLMPVATPFFRRVQTMDPVADCVPLVEIYRFPRVPDVANKNDLFISVLKAVVMPALML